jgi:hypothetical protein
MAENEKGMLSGLSEAFKSNPKARKGLLISGSIILLLIVIGGIGLSKRTAPPTVPTNVSLPGAPSGKSGDLMDRANTNQVYKDLVKKTDEERAAAAETKPGAMVLPKLPGLTDPTVKPAVEQVPTRNPLVTAAPPQYVTTDGQGGQAAASRDASDQALRQTDQYRNAQKILGAAVERSLAGAGGAFTVIKPPESQGQPGSAQGVTQVSTGASAAGMPAPAEKALIRAGDAFFATIDTAINTDYKGPIIATIRQGKFAGARLSGNKELSFDAVLIHFTLLSPKGGEKSFPIDAYAILAEDAKKFGTTGIPGETDYHIFQRYVIPGALAFVQAFGYASSIPEQTVTNGAYGSTVTQAPLTTSQKLWVAAGGAMGPFQKDMERLAARPITITIPAGQEIGILFASDVMPNAQPQLPAAVRAAQAQQAQQGQQGQAGDAPPAAAPAVGPSSAITAATPRPGGTGFPVISPAGIPTTGIPTPTSLLPSPFPQSQNPYTPQMGYTPANPYGQTTNPYYGGGR